MYSKEITVTNQVGLYARPATFFIQKANEFRSTMMVEKARTASPLLHCANNGIFCGLRRFTQTFQKVLYTLTENNHCHFAKILLLL